MDNEVSGTEPKPFRPEHNIIMRWERRQRSDASAIGTFGNRKAERRARKLAGLKRGQKSDKIHDEPETDGYKLPSEMASFQTEAVEMGSLDLGPTIDPGSPEEAEMDAIVSGAALDLGFSVPAEKVEEVKKKRASRAKKKVETQE